MSAEELGPDESPEPAARPDRQTTRIGYDAVLATFVAVLAVAVSAYTAYVQRQQVRAQVWPVLEFSTGNDPVFEVSIANKGVGPALIKNVIITADGVPVTDWRAMMVKLLGPGTYWLTESDIHDRVLSAGESKTLFTPIDADKGGPMKVGPEGSPGARFDKARFKIGAEICYCSTLDDCWTLIQRPDIEPAVVETVHCPAHSATSFRQ
jgi:hypothetical protein